MDSSLLYPLFATDQVPTALEASQLREICSEREEQLSSLEFEIERLQCLLRERDNERRLLREVLNVHKAPLSALRRIPPEILQCIFVHCLPTTHNSVMHSSEAPMLLGRVCRKWRAIAYGTPELWSSVHVVMPARDRNEEPTEYEYGFLDGLEAWLSRSGITPLNISVHCSHRSSLSVCLKLLAKFCRRWKCVEFLNAPSYWKSLPELSDMESGDLPVLETFIVRASSPKFGWYRPQDHPTGMFQALENVPSLRRIVVTDNNNVMLPNFSWAHLHDLYLVSSGCLGLALESDHNSLVEVLAQCPNLQKCTIRCALWRQSAIESNSSLSVTLPYLHELSLVFRLADLHSMTLVEILDRLTAPKLSSFEFRGTGERDELTTLTRFLERSSCPLRKFSVALGDFTKRDFVELLPLIHHITDLTIQNWSAGMRNDDDEDMNDWILAVLTPGSPESQEALQSQKAKYSAYCPKLVSFTLLEPSNTLSTQLLAFLYSRACPSQAGSVGVETLRSMKCSFRTVVPDDRERDIENLRRSGLKLDIGAPKPMIATVQRRRNPWDGISKSLDEDDG